MATERLDSQVLKSAITPTSSDQAETSLTVVIGQIDSRPRKTTRRLHLYPILSLEEKNSGQYVPLQDVVSGAKVSAIAIKSYDQEHHFVRRSGKKLFFPSNLATQLTAMKERKHLETNKKRKDIAKEKKEGNIARKPNALPVIGITQKEMDKLIERKAALSTSDALQEYGISPFQLRSARRKLNVTALRVRRHQYLLKKDLARMFPAKHEKTAKLFSENTHLMQVVLRNYGQQHADTVREALYLAAENFKPQNGKFKSFALTLMRNKVIDEIRRETRRQEAFQKIAREAKKFEETFEEKMLKSINIEEKKRVIGEILKTLLPTQRKAIELIFFAGLTYLAASKKLRVPAGTVKSRVRKGLENIRMHPKAGSLKD